MSLFHKDAPNGDIHVIHQWAYADATAKAAASGFVSTDVGKVALQIDTAAYYILTATTPTWQKIGDGTAANLTGTLAISKGGTGQTTKGAAFDALSPVTTDGDLIARAGGTNARLPVGSSGQVLKVVGGAPAWATFSGGINYISSNSDAEADTSGYATYADAAGNKPVDGTGGTATGLTFSRSTSSPLRGTASFSMAQANSTSLQGKGVSYDFTIDAADKAKMLAISFDYNASSTFVASNGTTAPLNDGTTTTNAGNSDVEVFIYDVTNAVLIPVSPQVIAANGSNNFTFKGEFQTASNSTSYRLIWHVATTSANATGWTFKFDNVYVGPQTQLLGPARTDWQSYTPTFTGFGTPSSVSFQYCRDGDTLWVKGTFLPGTTTATEARVSFPSGLTSDSSLPTISVAGDVGATSGSATTIIPVALVEPSVTYFTFGYLQGANSNLTKQNGNSGFASSTVSLLASVKVAGWASTSVMSNDTDARVVTSKATLGTASGTFTTGVIAKVPFNSISGLWDTHGGWDLTNNRYTAPVSGYYRITNTLCWSTATGLKLTSYRVNGGSDNFMGTITGSDRINTSTTEYLKAGDYIEIWGRQDSGGNASLSATGVSNSYACIERVSGPATIAASESVNCAYYIGSNQALSAAGIINFDTKDYDTHGAATTGASWKFTAPVSGLYSILGFFTLTTASQNDIAVYKNGSSVRRVCRIESGNGEGEIVGTVKLLAGDYIDFRSNSGSITAQGSGQACYVAITRVGS
jgi:hypothetical protein